MSKRSLIIVIIIVIFAFLFSCLSTNDIDFTFIFYNHHVMLPQNYAEQDSLPLILYLHGRGGGENLTLSDFQAYGIGQYASENDDFPFIVVAPLIPDDSDWHINAVDSVLKYIISNYKVDISRVYLTGYSLGGQGTYWLASKHPEKFAAISPVAGWATADIACSLIDLPIWIFHDSGDPVVPFYEAEQMKEASEECGGSVLFTEYHDSTHTYYNQTYSNQDLYDWFLSYTNVR